MYSWRTFVSVFRNSLLPLLPPLPEGRPWPTSLLGCGKTATAVCTWPFQRAISDRGQFGTRRHLILEKQCLANCSLQP